MNPLDILSDTLANLNKTASPTVARAEHFASWRDAKTGKKMVRMKLRGLQSAALGSFTEADAMMLAVLWNKRAEIIARLQDDCRNLALTNSLKVAA